ncbi:general stress protein [Sutcliffiella horikoshii]|uniref:general stress protein n=1 Tax=Sutcliffiella horikoshii TaxID=79883 RepID=UPI001CFF0140|nr:general stress protein [Sutcliffiella horikoshii]
MNEQRKEVIGSYLMEEEALAKIDWLQSEGYQPEEIWIIRDNRGIVEQFGRGGFSRAHDEREAQLNEYSSINPSSSIVTPKSLFTPENKSVAVTLMEMGIAKEEAYRYEFDVKVGKVLVLAETISNVKLRQEALTETRMERYATEEPALHLEDSTEALNTEKPVVSNDERVTESSTSINRPMPDTNIDGSIPLDEQLLSGDPGETEKDYAREEVTALHDQASVTTEATTLRHTRNPDLELEEKLAREQHTSTNNGKRYAENSSEEDVDKALLYEHGQPFPMEKPYEEDVYDQRVVSDGPLGVELEETAGDMSRSQEEKPLFSSTETRDASTRTRTVDYTPSAVNRDERLTETEDKGPILFEDTLQEIERDEPLVDSYEPTSYETEQPGDIYAPEEETSVHIDEETYMQEENVRHTEERDDSLFEEDHSEGPFSDRKKERMTQKRNNLFNDQDDDLFRR